MYFGTRRRMTNIADPAPGSGSLAVGYSSRLDFLNGLSSIRTSTNAHMEYNFTWGSLTRDQIAAIEDYAFGQYGDDVIYFTDPYAMDRNLFNRAWASPKITAQDGIPLVGLETPELVTVGDVSLDYPYQAAQYEITAGDPARVFHCPVPQGYTAWVGCHGISNARGLVVQPVLNGNNTGAVTQVATTAVNTTTRFTASFPSSGITGLDIIVDNRANVTLTLAGLMLQVLPTGQAPANGPFISGRGNSGVIFEEKPQMEIYSIPGESNALTAKLVEVGDAL